MARLEEIIAFCDELLEISRFEDYGPNGLQFPGSGEVTKVASGVSAHLELLESARRSGAELVIAHHGILWDAQPRTITVQMKARLRALIEGDLSLAAYHLPLDAHPELGNNALLARALGFEPSGEGFGVVRGVPIGVIGRSSKPVPVELLVQRVAEAVGRPPLHLPGGPDEIASLGVITGGGASALPEAIGLGLDAMITGEPSEPAMADALEGRIHFLAAGHYATETFGIRALGDVIADRFGIEHVPIEIPNPV